MYTVCHGLCGSSLVLDPRVLKNARVFGGKVKLKYLLHSGAHFSGEAYFISIPFVYDQPLVVIVLGLVP